MLDKEEEAAAGGDPLLGPNGRNAELEISITMLMLMLGVSSLCFL